MADEKTIILPESNGNNGFGNFTVPLTPMGFGGGFGGGYANGLGGFNSIADLFGLAIIASMFGWGNGGFGGGFGGFGGGNAAGFLSNQLNNDSGRELIMNAVTSQGEANRSAVQNLATMLGQDFNLVNSAVQNVQNALQTLALQQAVSVPQIINSIQGGNASLSHQLCECCCNMRQQVAEQGYQNQLATLGQTNTLGNAISGSGQRTVDAISDLKTVMVKEFCDAKERDMQEKIDGLLTANSTLRGQIDNANQTNQIIGYINSVVSPLQKDIDDVKCKLPNTVSVPYPQLSVVNSTPNIGGYWTNMGSPFNGFNSWGYGNGWGGSYWG